MGFAFVIKYLSLFVHIDFGRLIGTGGLKRLCMDASSAPAMKKN
jgi:hypothetical protein